MAEEKKQKQEKKKSLFSSLSNIGIGEERDFFMDNLSMLLSSGIDILSALEAVKEEMRSKRMRQVVAYVQEDIDAGLPVWRALERTNLLSGHIISLVRIGEKTGRLPENLKVIVAERQKERLFKSKIRGAMMYPVLVLSITLVIGVVIAWFILPRLAKVFGELRMELPFITKVLIAIGKFLGVYGAIAIPAFLVGSALIFYFVFIFSRTKFIGQSILFHIPVIKRLILEVELARFGYILGTLLDAGLPILDALDSLQEVSTFRMYQRLYAHLRVNVEEGSTFQKAFKKYSGSNGLIPVSVQQMVGVAEQSGTLAEMLRKVGSTYEEKTDITTKSLSVILEPILLVIVWFGVVGVALAVILPVYSLIGGIK